MENEILYEDQNLRLEFVKNGNYIHETWWGVTTPDVFARLLDVIIATLDNKSATAIILDAREHKGLGPESQALAAEKVSAYAKKVGTFKQAIIIPKDVFSKFSVQNFSEKMSKDKEVITQYFEDLEKAQNWLQN